MTRKPPFAATLANGLKTSFERCTKIFDGYFLGAKPPFQAFTSAVAIALTVAGHASAAPISLNWDVTDLGGSYQYDFELVVDNNDGTFVQGMAWDWFVIGDAPFGSPRLFPERAGFFTSVPTGWTASSTGGSSNGPSLNFGATALTPYWTPTLGEKVMFSGVSSALVAEDALLWSALRSSGGAPGVRREVATFTESTPSAVPLPAGAWLLIGGIGALATLRRRRDS